MSRIKNEDKKMPREEIFMTKWKDFTKGYKGKIFFFPPLTYHVTDNGLNYKCAYYYYCYYLTFKIVSNLIQY